MHTCCAPCLIYPLEVLRGCGFEVEAYFYNPNIYPEEEFLRRREAFLDFANTQGLKVHLPEPEESDFRNCITSAHRPQRCLDCWHFRLLKTAEFARENDFASFTTALLASPYQDSEAMKNIGEKIAEDTQVNFLYRDFRPGFREAHNKARALGIYCQKYCGCRYSLEERTTKK